MINDIVIIIWEDHVYYQESLVIYNNIIYKGLIIYVEPMDIIICVVSGVYNFLPPPDFFFHDEFNLNKVGGIFFSNIL